MSSRRIRASELAGLLDLYAFLHPEDPVVDVGAAAVQEHWRVIFENPNLRYYVAEADRKIVSTCTLTVIPNLTRGLRPYGVIENVVTDPAYRRRGFAKEVLKAALDDAWRSGCYKVMLETGRSDEGTLRFYEKAGFKSGVKTGLVAYPEAACQGGDPLV